MILGDLVMWGERGANEKVYACLTEEDLTEAMYRMGAPRGQLDFGKVKCEVEYKLERMDFGLIDLVEEAVKEVLEDRKKEVVK